MSEISVRVKRTCSKCGLLYDCAPSVHDYEFPIHEGEEKDTCRYCLTWEMIIDIYRSAYRNDSYMQTVLSSAERTIFELKPQKLNPDPIRFRTILSDRGIEIDKRVQSVWNIAKDESCKYMTIARWEDNEIANIGKKVLNILGNIRL